MSKNFFTLFIAAMFISVVAFAQQNVAVLHSSGEVNAFMGHKSLITALDSAQSGDTIYLSGGIFATPSEITKGVAVIGAGFYPDSTLATSKTILGGNIKVSGTADNFYLEGVEITGDLTLASSADTINNVTLIRNKINGKFGGGANGRRINACNVIGCVLVSGFAMNYCDNTFVTNNIIASKLYMSNYNTISNNIFLSALGLEPNPGIADFDYNTVRNNIFLNKIVTYSSSLVHYNLYENNMTISATPAYGSGANITATKWEGVSKDDIFVSQDSTIYNYGDNYHLKKPSTWIGTDGSEIGIYGGAFPWKEGAIPSNPHIRSNKTASQTDSQGKLQLDIEVVAQ